MKKATYPLGIVAAVLIILVSKSYLLGAKIGGAHNLAPWFFIYDYHVFEIVVVLASLSCILSFIRTPFLILAAAVALSYFLHSSSILLFSTPLSLKQLFRMLPEVEIWVKIFEWHVWLIAILLILLCLINLKISKTLRSHILIITITFTPYLLLYFSNKEFPEHYKHFLFNPPDLIQEVVQLKGSTDSAYPKEIASFEAEKLEKSIKDVSLPNAKNIIVLFVESLTSTHSSRISGVYDFVPKLDAISKKGKLFINHFSNGPDSEHGQIAFLTGLPPLHAPLSVARTYSDFQGLPSVINQYRSLGFKTDFLIGCSLSWLGMKQFLEHVGFDRIRGRREVSRFTDDKIHVFSSVSDEVLYAELLDTVKSWKKTERNLLFVATSSSHTPWSNPRTKETGENAAFQYVDDTISELYENLLKTGFFDDGILVITGDHRKLSPPSQEEINRYSWETYGRVPLLILGKNVPEDSIDERYLQHTEVLKNLGKLIKGEELPEKEILFTSISSSGFLRYRGEREGNLWIFNKALKGARIPFILDGVGVYRIPMIQELQKASSETIKTIHSIRAGLQGLFSKRTGKCGVNSNFKISKSQGLNFKIYKGANIIGDFSDREIAPGYPDIVQALTLPESLQRRGVFYSTRFIGGLEFKYPGEYWFRIQVDDGVCLGIGDQEVIISPEIKEHSIVEGSIRIENPDIYPFELRYFQYQGESILNVEWKEPGADDYTLIPEKAFFLPQ